MIDLATELLKKHEGYRRFPYLDTVGVQTIGYGRNLQNVGISEVEASQLLSNDIGRAVVELISMSYFKDLSDVRKAVLVDMVVNLGFPRFSAFRKLDRALRRGEFDLAKDEMLDSLWAHQVKGRAVELAEMMEKG